MSDLSESLQQQVSDAVTRQQSLRIQGGNSKAFYGNPLEGETLSTQGHSGIIDYEPAELVITARSGTPLQEIEKVLADNNQMLPFEPPHYASGATLGGTIACGFSGNRRPYTGAVRDFMLGCQVINGNGEILRFGGQVMKNVAGYDVSRLMVGAMGTLGVILEASFKVLPRPAREITLVQQHTIDDAIQLMNQLAGKPVPLSAAVYYDGHVYLRLSGAEQAVEQSLKLVAGEQHENGQHFWQSINEQTHRFFKSDQSLWRISINPAAPALGIEEDMMLDWGGAQRWVYTDFDAQTLRDKVAQLGGHATCFRNPEAGVEIFHPLEGKLKQLHLELKSAFDPRGILNYQAMYPGV